MRANVFEGAWPTSAGIADAAILDVPGGNAFRGQRGAEVSAVGQIVLGAPVASVDGHHHRERAFGFGKAKICELIGIGAVGETGIGWRWRQVENVFGGHRFGRGTDQLASPVLRFLFSSSRTIVICDCHLCWDQLHYCSFTPAVFLDRETGDGAMQLGLGFGRDDAGSRC